MIQLVSNMNFLVLSVKFFLATSIAYVVHELATHPDIQQKVQQEIDDYEISEVFIFTIRAQLSHTKV